MKGRFTTKNFKLALLNIAVLAMSFVSTGCERKELWLRTNGIEFSIAIYDIRLELLWGVDWESQWQYEWDESLFGNIGYSEPDWIRAIIYNHDMENDSRTPHIRFQSAQNSDSCDYIYLVAIYATHFYRQNLVQEMIQKSSTMLTIVME